MRRFPLVLLLATLLPAASSELQAAADSNPQTKPNILLIVTDDKCDALGTMGAEEAEIVGKRTPRPQ